MTGFVADMPLNRRQAHMAVSIQMRSIGITLLFEYRKPLINCIHQMNIGSMAAPNENEFERENDGHENAEGNVRNRPPERPP